MFCWSLIKFYHGHIKIGLSFLYECAMTGEVERRGLTITELLLCAPRGGCGKDTRHKTRTLRMQPCPLQEGATSPFTDGQTEAQMLLIWFMFTWCWIHVEQIICFFLLQNDVLPCFLFSYPEGLVLASHGLLFPVLSMDCTQRLGWLVKLTIDVTEVLRTKNPRGWTSATWPGGLEHAWVIDLPSGSWEDPVQRSKLEVTEEALGWESVLHRKHGDNTPE